MVLLEDSIGTDPLMTPEDIACSGSLTGDFVGITTRPVHVQDGDIQCLKHCLWQLSRIHRTIVTYVTFVSLRPAAEPQCRSDFKNCCSHLSLRHNDVGK